ncbi:MAG: SDR family NAD(P)-dependent oxidoreductase [Candidatus Lokiarchaeota archaeon]|nr:SDR family NAD(P)-dependent oxidoreductase [Candidatus Lokiarchaeota archaeon]
MNNVQIEKDVKTIIDSLKNSAIDYKGLRVLITGGAGFLGSYICDVLIEMGATVVCVDNLSSGRLENIQALIDQKEDQFTFIRQDIVDASVLEIEDQFDVILHLASRAAPMEFEKYPIAILSTNTIGTMNALELAKRSNAKILFTSTSETYGDPDPQFVPTKETYAGSVISTGIRSCYEEGKRSGEAFMAAYQRQYGINTRIVRIFNTYGPKIRADGVYGRVVPRFVNQALIGDPITVFGDGAQTRSFSYVTDTVEGILRAAILDSASGEIFNIGNDKEMTVLQLAKIVKEQTTSDSEFVFSKLPEGDPKRRCPDITKAKTIINWSPKVELDAGLRNFISWVSELK